ncbi:thiol:disulfide interchange protein [Renibacterium salmoninarum ATCC 33209]|uniref:Thiol:disulfide interchange protein n=1 Tax=Renibacterium salmoninarum (strain ATCC 33209 / DSM 20767 / JCM 11484 / NBRC 15589 / NCIMB 2235) TaxID=288705 RepID=A9WS01_RENSM|nr:TlpA disulfide reductase family protein [Renibacterium salmoninarum]ABY24433.1 thiol:disulfide interchange protein [Renibacterium salmoninarum ATCC 33209]
MNLDGQDPVAETSKTTTSRRRGTLRRRAIFAAAAVSAALVLSACTANDPLAQQAKAGYDKNYIAGDGSVTEYALGKRTDPVDFTGKLYDGTEIASKSFEGKVTVLNFWYAACAPCRVEAPDLEALNKELSPQGAEFYGVNIRDSEGTATPFMRTFNLSYPSFNDKDGAVLLAVAAQVPPAAVPTTLVLDKDRRVAARILGLADKSTLKALITSTLAESGATESGAASPTEKSE